MDKSRPCPLYRSSVEHPGNWCQLVEPVWNWIGDDPRIRFVKRGDVNSDPVGFFSRRVRLRWALLLAP